MVDHRIGLTLDVIGWNTHNELAAARYLKRQTFDIAAVFEAQKQRAVYERFRSHRYLTGEAGRPDDLMRETGILVPRGHEVRGHTVEKMSDTVKAEALWRVGKERWGHVVVMNLLGHETAVIAAHPVAGASLAGTSKEGQIIAAYADFADWLEAQFTYHRRYMKREVIFISDVQVRENAVREWTPHDTFEEFNLETHWEKIDVIGWTNRFKALQTDSHEEGLPSNHPLMRVRLARSKA